MQTPIHGDGILRDAPIAFMLRQNFTKHSCQYYQICWRNDTGGTGNIFYVTNRTRIGAANRPQGARLALETMALRSFGDLAFEGGNQIFEHVKSFDSMLTASASDQLIISNSVRILQNSAGRF